VFFKFIFEIEIIAYSEFRLVNSSIHQNYFLIKRLHFKHSQLLPHPFLSYLCTQIIRMKKLHIILLVLIAGAIGLMASLLKDVTTYATIASAKQKPGKSVKLIARLDKSKPIEYNPIKNPNYLKFTAVDTLGNTTTVVYYNAKPTDMEKSERLVLTGKMVNDYFECKDILLKCPSKYKDDTKQAEKQLIVDN